MDQNKSLWRRGAYSLILLLLLAITCNKATGQSRIIISQYIETSSGTKPKGIELWNPTDTPIDFSVDSLTIWQGTNGDAPGIKAIIKNEVLEPNAVMIIGTSDIADSLAAHGYGNVLYSKVSFTFNGDDALQIQLGGSIEDTFGKPGEDPGSSWDGNGVSTRNSNIELKDGITAGSPDGFTDPSERFQTVSTDNSLGGFGMPPGGTVTTPKPEPSEDAQFNDPDTTPHSITLHWNAAGGEVPADGYLIKSSGFDPDSIGLPVDGVPEDDDTDLSDEYGTASVAQGIESAMWDGLEAGKTYYFRIFSFTNSGPDINYKTDEYDSVSVTTAKESTPEAGIIIPAKINEFHYDNAGTDTGEFVEVALDTAVEAAKMNLLLYNGSNGGVYKTTALSDYTPGETRGQWRFYSMVYPSIQNGPDGMALIYHFNDRDTVLQFISYEGSFTASEGPANGMKSKEIGVSESSAESGMSLGLGGLLTDDDNTSVWTSMVATPGKMNDRQSVTIKSDTLISRRVITGDAGWRMLSSPVAGLTYEDLQSNTPIQGFPGTSPGSDKNLFTGYDGNNWTSPVGLSEPIRNGGGFILYFFNNNIMGSRKLPVDFDLKGGIPTTSVTVPLHTNGDRFNLMGNPFPWYIDMNNIVVNDGNLASSVAQIWDDKKGSYDLSTEQDNRIAPCQGFFIQNDNAASITIESNDPAKKTIAREVSDTPQKPVIIGFRIQDADSMRKGKVLDKATAIYFSNDAKPDWDRWDVQKLVPLKSDYAILGIKGSINDHSILKAEESRPLLLTEPVTFQLTMSGPGAAGEKTIQWPVWKNVPASWGIKLKDLKTGHVVDMTTDSLYRFTVDEIEAGSSASSTILPEISAVRVSEIPETRFEVTVSPTGTETENSVLKPGRIKLLGNYPNPFNPATTIKFYLPRAMATKLTVYDILGRRVTVLVDGAISFGWHTVTWKAGSVSSGVYFYRLETPGKVLIKKMLLIR